MSRGHQGPPVRGLQTLLSLFGYDIEPSGAYDVLTETVVTAFQRHFRPERVDGQADAGAVDVLSRLLTQVQSSTA